MNRLAADKNSIRIGILLLVVSMQSSADDCIPPAFNQVGYEYAVPSDVLYAIALAESGRSTKEYGFKVWPWALNINGNAHYPANKEEAIFLIENEILLGREQFDIGVMQVNWRFHKRVFDSNAEYALDVASNLRAGAKVLKDFMNTTDDIWLAVGFYNAGNSSKPSSILAAKKYSDRVKRIYFERVMEACHENLALGH